MTWGHAFLFACALWEAQLAVWAAQRNNRTKHRVCAAASALLLFLALWS